MKEDEAKRLRLLELENARLKRIVAEEALDATSPKSRSGDDRIERRAPSGLGRIDLVRRRVLPRRTQLGRLECPGRNIAGSVQTSAGGKVIRIHRICHDRSKKHGAFAMPNGKPHRKAG